MVLVLTLRTEGEGRNGPAGILSTTNATDLKPWEMLGVSFKVSEDFKLI